jgi:hypothetical protein
MFNQDSMKKTVGSESFVVVFTKKDGSLREMVCQVNNGQFGIKAQSSAELNPTMLAVYDMEFYAKLKLTAETSNKACRSVNLSTLKQVLFNNNVLWEAA